MDLNKEVKLENKEAENQEQPIFSRSEEYEQLMIKYNQLKFDFDELSFSLKKLKKKVKKQEKTNDILINMLIVFDIGVVIFAAVVAFFG